MYQTTNEANSQSNIININKLTRKQSANLVGKETFIDCIDVTSEEELSQRYAAICQQHEGEKKWIMMISPEENSLDQLTHDHRVDTTKILRVNAQKVQVKLDNIKAALCKGNCSAVVLSDSMIDHQQIAELTQCAQLGNTKCVVISDKRKLH